MARNPLYGGATLEDVARSLYRPRERSQDDASATPAEGQPDTATAHPDGSDTPKAA